MNIYALKRVGDYQNSPFELVQSGLSGGETRQALLDRFKEEFNDKWSTELAEDLLYKMTDTELCLRVWEFSNEFVIVRPA